MADTLATTATDGAGVATGVITTGAGVAIGAIQVTGEAIMATHIMDMAVATTVMAIMPITAQDAVTITRH